MSWKSIGCPQIEIQIISFNAVSAFKAIYKAKIKLQKYKYHTNTIKQIQKQQVILYHRIYIRK